MRRRAAAIAISLLAVSALGAPAAWANREVLSEHALETTFCARCAPPGGPPAELKPPPAGQIEGACGLTVSGSTIYISDYYRRTVDLFSTSGAYSHSQILLPGGAISGLGINELDGVCGLAADSSGDLYANEWHRGVLQLQPSEASIDTGESTGVALDAAGDLYANDRTYVARYDAPVTPGDAPAVRIGEGSLGDGYGLAVAGDGSRVYVPDAVTQTVKVFEPETSPTTPVASISPPGDFVSLHDAALAVDPTNGHLIVVDDDQPGYEYPEAALYEFDAAGAFLGKLACAPIDGGPSGIAFDAGGDLYVTDGSGELSNAFEYGPYTTGSVGTPACSSSGGSAVASSTAFRSPAGSAPAVAPGAAPVPLARSKRVPLRGKGGGASLVQKGPIRVKVSGGLAPTRLPRTGTAPVSVAVGGLISSTDPKSPPQLRKVSFAFNRAGRLDTGGLPRCRLTDIDPSSTRQALAACHGALVGEGRFAANVLLPEQSPFPSDGKVLAFNGVLHGKPVIFAHIYGTRPVPTSVVLVLRVHHSHGTFGTRMDASLAGLTGEWGYVRSISLRLGRKFSFGGRRRSYLSAGCPAPNGFPGVVFPLARASFTFDGGRTLSATLTRSCTVRR